MSSERTFADDGLGRTAKLSAIWASGSRVGLQLFRVVVSVFLARLLTPADFGVVAAAGFFVTLATRLTQMGLNASLVRMKELRAEHASTVFVVNLVAGILAFLILQATKGVLGGFFGSGVVGIVLGTLSIVFLITPFGTVPAALLQRRLSYRSSNFAVLLGGVSNSVVSVVLAWYEYGYWSLVVGTLAGTSISTLAKLYMSQWKVSVRFTKVAFLDVMSFGLGFQAKSLVNFAGTNLDKLIVGRFLGVTGLGYYDKAKSLMSQLTERMIVGGSLFRIFSMINEEPERFRRAVMKSTQAVTLVILPIGLLSVLVADDLIPVLFGRQWEASIGPFRILTIVGILGIAAGPVLAANESLGLVWKQTAIQVAGLVLTVSGVAVGSRWGLTACAIGLLISSVVRYALSVRLLIRSTPMDWIDLWRSFWPSLATAGVVGGGVFVVELMMADLLVERALVLALDVVVAIAILLSALLWSPVGSVGEIVSESVDDIVPWVRRWVCVGVLARP